MGNISRYSPDLWLTEPFIADHSLTVGQVVIQGTADGHCTAPLGSDFVGVLGVAISPVSASAVTNSQNNVSDICTRGIVRCVANGTITRGDRVVVATSAGDVSSYDGNILTLPSYLTRVGYALESVTTTQNVAILLDIGPVGMSLIGTYTAGTGGVTANMVCCFGTSGDAGKVILPSGADLALSGKVAGIALATAIATATVKVLQFGYGIVSAGDSSLTSGGMPLAIQAASGTVKLAAPGGGTNDFIVGYSNQAISTGTTGIALINPQIVQG